MCEEAVGDDRVMICIENCDGFLPFQLEALGVLLESDVFGLTFDIGHNHSCGNLDEPFILQNKTRLHHMHVHDAAGRKNHPRAGYRSAEYSTIPDPCRRTALPCRPRNKNNRRFKAVRRLDEKSVQEVIHHAADLRPNKSNGTEL